MYHSRTHWASKKRHEIGNSPDCLGKKTAISAGYIHYPFAIDISATKQVDLDVSEAGNIRQARFDFCKQHHPNQFGFTFVSMIHVGLSTDDY